MFALPQVISVPLLSSVAGIQMDWPWLGAFLAWVAVAALVGTSLGFLREHTRSIPAVHRPKLVGPQALPLNERHFDVHTHREAA
ncbi:MAG TPA: hypothetical protein VN812_02135 [Candidatus Acidoferrales bacterium]|nr:hypothetical protein [Candidatus Acidoferrales bacterium]